jgi:hypothetical protein
VTERADHGLSIACERILKAASSVGHYIPRTKEQTHLCMALRSKGYFEQSDNLPGAFEVTLEGEHVLSELEPV